MNKKLHVSMISLLSLLMLAGCNPKQDNPSDPSNKDTTPSADTADTSKQTVTLTKLAISNKDAFAGPIYENSDGAGSANVRLQLAVDDGQSAQQLINSHDIEITSSNPAVAQVIGAMVAFEGIGDCTITVKNGELTDSVSFYVGNQMSLVPEDTAVGVNQEMLVAINSKKNSTNASDYNWSTSDSAIATVSADGKVKGVKEGNVTVYAKLKTNEKEFAKIDVKVEKEVSLPVAINKVTKAGNYTVRGKIVAKGQSYFLIADETGVIEVYTKTSLAVGAVVKVTGKVVSYNNIMEFSGKPTIIEVGAKVTPNEEATELTDELAGKIEKMKSDGSESVTYMKKYTWNAVATMSGTYKCLNIGKHTIEPDKLDTKKFPFEVGKYYQAEGYFIGYSSSHKYISMLITGLKETAPAKSVATLNYTSLLAEKGTTRTLKANLMKSAADSKNADLKETWTSSDETIATVKGGVITALKAGKATITYAFGNDAKATCDITVTDTLTVSKLTDVTENKKVYKVQGVVVSLAKEGYIISDGTAAFHVHLLSADEIKFKVGDFVEAIGSANVYNGQISFYKVTAQDVTKATGTAPDVKTFEKGTALTKEIADGFVSAEATPVANYKKYSWTAVVGKAGKYFTYNFDGSKTVIEADSSTPSAITRNVKEGKTYQIEGYFLGYHTGHHYASFHFTRMSQIIKTEIDADATKFNLVKGEKKTVKYSWTTAKDVALEDVLKMKVSFTSEDPTIATVTSTGSDFTITAVKAGKTKIIAKITDKDGKDAYKAEYDVTVNNPGVEVTSKNLNLPDNASTDVGTAKVNGVSFEYAGVSGYGKKINFYGNTSSHGVSGRTAADGEVSYISNTSAFSSGISSVVFTLASNKYANNDILLVEFGTDNTYSSFSQTLSTKSGVTEYTVTPDKTTYTFVKVSFNKDYKTQSHSLAPKSINFFLA